MKTPLNEGGWAIPAGEPSAGFVRIESLPLWRRANFERELRTLLLFLAGVRAGAWSVLRILFAIDDPPVVFGRSRRWRVERPHNSVAIDDSLVVFGLWRVERPHNSVRDRRSSRGFRPLPAGFSLNRSTNLALESTFP